MKTLAEKAAQKREHYKQRKEAGLCIQCGTPSGGYLRCKKCKDADQVRSILHAARTYRELKYEIFDEYGGECACCHLSDWRFLTIDHVYNDGASHRKEIGGRTRNLLKWLKQHNFPKDRFQLLCWNCNMAKARNGGVCPHNIEKALVA